MKKYTLRLSTKFGVSARSNSVETSQNTKSIVVEADEVQINGIAHGGVYVFKTKAKTPQDIMNTIALYPVQDTIIEKIEDIKENE